MANLLSGYRGDSRAALTQLAAQQEDLATTAQLAELGLSYAALSKRHSNFQLHRVHRGVYLVGCSTLSPLGQLLATSLAVGGKVAVAGGSAGAALGLLSPAAGPIEVLTNTTRRNRPGIRVGCAELAPEEVCRVGPVPVTSPLRTLVAIAAQVDLGSLEAAVHRGRRRGWFGPGELERARARYTGHHGLAALALLLQIERAPDFSRSKAERMLVELIREAGLPAPLRNHPTCGCEVDLAWPEHRLVVEFDSYTFHGDRRAFERDRRKWAWLQSKGWRVIPVTWLQLQHEPAWIIARIAELCVGENVGDGEREPTSPTKLAE